MGGKERRREESGGKEEKMGGKEGRGNGEEGEEVETNEKEKEPSVEGTDRMRR